MRPLLLAGLLAACGGGPSKPAATVPTENVVEEEAPPPEDEVADPSVEPYVPPEARPMDQASLDAGGTGSLACDALIARTRCSFHKAGTNVPPESVQAFEDGIPSWVDALADQSMRSATMDACKMLLDARHSDYVAQGC